MTASRQCPYRSSALAAAVVCAVLLAGCGGGAVAVPGSSRGVAGIGPSGAVSVSSSEGSVVIGDQQLPSGWPSELGRPSGFTVAASATTKVGGTDALTVSFAADGDQSPAVASWIDRLVVEGFSKKNTLGAAGTAGGIVGLENARWEVQTITVAAAGKTSVVVHVKPAGA